MNIDAHYTEEAKNHGDSPLSTMPEQLVRELETKVILDTMRSITRLGRWKGKTFLDYGCGNGYTLSLIGQEFPELSRYGYEPNGDMLRLASKHAIMLPSLSKDQIDILLCQRCLINLSGWNEQAEILCKLHDALVPGGFILLLECWESGIARLNVAREQLGLSPIKPAAWNIYLPNEPFDTLMAKLGLQENPSVHDLGCDMGLFGCNRHFLSTHSFVSRVLYPAITRTDLTPGALVVQFLTNALPATTGYGRIEARLFRKQK